MKNSNSIQVRSSTVLFTGRIFDVVREEIELASGLRQDLAIVRHPGEHGGGHSKCGRDHRCGAGGLHNWSVDGHKQGVEVRKQPNG